MNEWDHNFKIGGNEIRRTMERERDMKEIEIKDIWDAHLAILMVEGMMIQLALER